MFHQKIVPKVQQNHLQGGTICTLLVHCVMEAHYFQQFPSHDNSVDLLVLQVDFGCPHPA